MKELDIIKSAHEVGISVALPFDPAKLKLHKKVRHACMDNKCGNYNVHYMCPPLVGRLLELETKLRSYSQGILLRHSQNLSVDTDPLGVDQSKTKFHRMILKLEQELIQNGITDLWGMMGGHCALCKPCHAIRKEPCPYPDQARTSMEAVGIHVLDLLDRLGFDNQFHPDQITWTGCILY